MVNLGTLVITLFTILHHIPQIECLPKNKNEISKKNDEKKKFYFKSTLKNIKISTTTVTKKQTLKNKMSKNKKQSIKTASSTHATTISMDDVPTSTISISQDITVSLIDDTSSSIYTTISESFVTSTPLIQDITLTMQDISASSLFTNQTILSPHTTIANKKTTNKKEQKKQQKKMIYAAKTKVMKKLPLKIQSKNKHPGVTQSKNKHPGVTQSKNKHQGVTTTEASTDGETDATDEESETTDAENEISTDNISPPGRYTVPNYVPGDYYIVHPVLPGRIRKINKWNSRRNVQISARRKYVILCCGGQSCWDVDSKQVGSTGADAAATTSTSADTEGAATDDATDTT